MAHTPIQVMTKSLRPLLVLLSIATVAFGCDNHMRESELVSISGTVERISNRQGAGGKTVFFLRTDESLVQINADPKLGRAREIAVGDQVRVRVAYEDLFGRDIGFLYELEKDGVQIRELDSRVLAGE